jgi:hypothetical protein
MCRRFSAFNGDGEECRETDDIGEYEVGFADGPLSDDETARLGIPTEPEWAAHVVHQINDLMVGLL